MSVSINELETWMAQRESENLEFKEAQISFGTNKLYRYCVAFANEKGGKLVLGVTDKFPRKVVGTNAFLNINDVKSKILVKLGFRVVVESVSHPDGRVLVFSIPSRPIGTPLHHEGSYLMRSGEDLVAMTPDQLRRIFDEGELGFLSQVTLTNLTAEEVVSLLDTQAYFDLIQIPYPIDRDGVLAKFTSEKLIKKQADYYEITNLGAVLFAKDLSKFESVSRKAPRVIVYDGTSKVSMTRSDIIGNKGFAVSFESLIQYINSQIPTNEVIGEAFREEVSMFPSIAIRELVANALIHQDFNERGTSVVVEIFADRMEISNPGKPFISPKRFIDEYQSRNEKLADIMRRLRICEEKGSGIDKVIHSVEAWQLPAPDFREGERQTKAVLYSHIPFDEMERKDKIRACYQHCCLKYVMNEKMSNESLRERFSLSSHKLYLVSRVIQDAMRQDLLKLDDPESNSKRYARYVPFWA